MVRMPLKPDLASRDCYAIFVNTQFSLGRRAVAECVGVAPRSLLLHGAGLLSEYNVNDTPHTISAFLAASTLSEEGPDLWDLSISCYSRAPGASERVSKGL